MNHDPSIEAQIELERLWNKNHLMPRLKAEFRQPEVIDHMTGNQIPLEFGIDLLCQMQLHKRTTVSILVGILHKHFGTGEGTQPDLQACADMLRKAAECNLIHWDALAGQMVIQINVHESVLEELELYQYPLPMIVEPRKVRTNRDTGYLTSKGSMILKHGNHHDEDICLDHINRVNAMALTINTDTARMVENQWRNLDKQKPDETRKEFQDRLTAFDKYTRNAEAVMEHITVIDDKFWLTNRYDKRGRTYAQGYHINPQGNDWNKAVIEFANQEVVTG